MVSGKSKIIFISIITIIMFVLPSVTVASMPLQYLKVDDNLEIYYFTLSFVNDTTYRYPYAVSISPDTKFLAIGLSNLTGTNFGPFESIVKIYKIDKIVLNSGSGGYVHLSLYRTIGPLYGRILEMKWIDSARLVLGMDTGISSDQAYIIGFNIHTGQQFLRIDYPGYDYVHGMDYYAKEGLLAVGIVDRNILKAKIIIYDSSFNEVASYILVGRGLLAIHFFHNGKNLAVAGPSLTALNLTNGSTLYDLTSVKSFDVDTMNLGSGSKGETLVVPQYFAGGFVIVNATDGSIKYSIPGDVESIQTLVFMNYVIDVSQGIIAVYNYNGTGFSHLASFAPGSGYYYAYLEKTLFVVSDRTAANVIVGILSTPKVSGELADSHNSNNNISITILILLSVLLVSILYIRRKHIA